MNQKKVKKAGLRKGGFTFKQFFVAHDKCEMKVGTDGVLLGAWAPIDNVKRALDIGTGSGLIALMLAQRASQIEHLDGIELDEKAASQATENAQESQWRSLIHIHHDDIYHYAEQAQNKYDLIVSNPPYFEPAIACRNDVREQARYTKTLTHEGLLDSAQSLITEDGLFCVVLPYSIGEQFIEIAEKKEWNIAKRVNIKDSADKPYHRILLAFQRQNQSSVECSIDELIIRNNEGHYTDKFRSWVTDFYLYY
ncbi:tRNA(1)(Val) (adenine(37)-N(6))-methyltransferase TrmN [Proteus terrae]|uniref:tRNA(1)(Val) (adenine(37)-N(6))-methyltransferase TrmN n=1 Tax=Proteus terrae TaxID=1574161 RepID=UPI001F29E8C4|nr:tRNA1(Val) (adenine(37)-N6)-methyltransferase [Proteus terrae]MCE9841178.1 tRNA1(Val) (adenine(37)-N6)-methyltransferase [Proteus terrae]